MSQEDGVYEISCSIVNEIVKDPKQRVALLFVSDECSTCQAVSEIKEKIEHNIKTPIIEINRNEMGDSDCQKLAKECEVSVYPTLVLYKNSKPHHTITFYGAESEKELEKRLRELDAL